LDEIEKAIRLWLTAVWTIPELGEKEQGLLLTTLGYRTGSNGDFRKRKRGRGKRLAQKPQNRKKRKVDKKMYRSCLWGKKGSSGGGGK